LATEKSKFIHQLVLDLKPKRQWSAFSRLVFWMFSIISICSFVMILYKPFRSNSLSDLFSYPRFLLEIVSAFCFSSFLVYSLFASLIPSFKIKKSIVVLGLSSGSLFITTLLLSLFTHSPAVSKLGARPHCVEEVFVYGLVSILSFLLYLKHSDYLPSQFHFFTLGMGVGIIPASLMQLACMYDPIHALLFHYGPIILVGLLGLSLPQIKRIFMNR
jgi:hypothetical protein